MRFSGAGRRLCMVVCALTLASCGGGAAAPSMAEPNASSDFFKALPAHFAKPMVPADNPMTAAKVELGRHLFYEPKLSGNNSQSCSSCHLQAKAFTDGLATPVGSTGSVHPRNAQSLANAAYNTSFNWANPMLTQMEAQNLLPIINQDPVELGVNDSNQAAVLARFKTDAGYARLFAQAFPAEAEPVTLGNIAKALASFNRTLLSYRAPFDRYEAGELGALSDSAQRGLALFESERLECNQCHSGFNFSDSTRISGGEALAFHNTGLYNITGLNGTDNYPDGNQGVFEFSGANGDKGRMKTPTLRNIALTAPYNHDGSTATLSEVIDNYARGGRLVTMPLTRLGDGRSNSVKDGEIHGFALTDGEKADLIAFLESLTDMAFVTDPGLSDPGPP